MIGSTINIRWFDVPTTKVKFGYGYESLYGVFDGWDREHCLRMRHEAISLVSACSLARFPAT